MIAVIGGSGLEDSDLLKDAEQVNVETPFGGHAPIKVGSIGKVKVALVSRHGFKHEYSPTTVPYKATIFALKELGCKAIIAASACGSLREEIPPATFSFPDQFIDRTTKRDQSYTKHGDLIHESMAEPFSIELRQILVKKCQELGFEFSADTTIVTIEGPRFSSKAESELFRSWGCDLINMTTVPEVCLAKELGIPYQVINLVTDYDCWREGTASVTHEEVLKVMKVNAEKVKKLILAVLPEVEKVFH